MRRSAEGVLPLATKIMSRERWPSGRRRTLGKRVYGNVSWVRIPPSPPVMLVDDPSWIPDVEHGGSRGGGELPLGGGPEGAGSRGVQRKGELQWLDGKSYSGAIPGELAERL